MSVGRLKFLFSKDRVDLEERATLCKDKFCVHYRICWLKLLLSKEIFDLEVF